MIIFVNVTPELEKSKDNSKEIEDATESLRKQLFIEKSLKTQAVNKLAEIMCRKDFMLLQRENSKKRKATSDDLRKKEKECRKLHQELGAVSWRIGYRPLLSYLLPLCQSESSCETILIKFHRQVRLHGNRTHFHVHGFARRLVLKQRQTLTPKWLIHFVYFLRSLSY